MFPLIAAQGTNSGNEGWNMGLFLASATSMMGRMSIVVAAIVTVIMIIAVIKRNARLVFTSLCIIIISSIGGIFMMKRGGSQSRSIDTATKSTTPSSEPTSSATQASDTASAAGPTILIILGIIGIGFAVTIVAFTVYLAVRRVRRDTIEAKNEQKRIAELEQHLDEKWKVITDLHSDLRSRVMNAETDWDTLFRYPAMTDVSYPQTAAMYEAMSAANLADDKRPADLTDDSDISELSYPKLVTKFETAYKRAENNARRIGQDGLPEEERRKIEQIRDMLRLAEDPNAAGNERTMAYERIHKALKELRHITVPQKAMMMIEDGKRLMLEKSATHV